MIALSWYGVATSTLTGSPGFVAVLPPGKEIVTVGFSAFGSLWHAMYCWSEIAGVLLQFRVFGSVDPRGVPHPG